MAVRLKGFSEGWLSQGLKDALESVALLAAAAAALGWANSPWRAHYAGLFELPVGTENLRFVINDGLMTLFFLVAGLEIRQATHDGELSDLRRASLPLFAAAGGMAVPALLYLAFNGGHASARGWGIPMATDIAFAVGVLALLGKRVPSALRLLLFALAVADDLGAILVITLFYSAGVTWGGIAVAALGVTAILLGQRLRIEATWVYLAPAVLVWWGLHAGGIHPSLAGVVVGLLTPPRHISGLRERLHPWVTLLIMPLFALANAGVQLGSLSLHGDALRVLLGVSLGLALGKPVGIVLVSWLCVRLGLSRLPSGMTWPRVAVLGTLGGVGFTMSLFVAQLAFVPGAELQAAKAAIVGGSILAATVGLVAGRRILDR